MALAARDRPGGRQAAHRPLAQRPGGHGPAAVAAAPHRRRSTRALARARAGARGARAAPRGRRHARPHARPAGAAGAVRASPAGLRRDARARPGPVRGCRAPRERVAARLGRARRAPASRSTARRSPRSSGFDGRHPQLDRRGRATATSWSRRWPRPRSAMVHLSRLAEELVWWSNPRFGFLRPSDAFSTGLVDDAQQAQPGPGRAGARPDRARSSGSSTGSLTLLKGLPAGYQRDLQEDKPPLFDGARRRSSRRCG